MKKRPYINPEVEILRYLSADAVMYWTSIDDGGEGGDDDPIDAKMFVDEVDDSWIVSRNVWED